MPLWSPPFTPFLPPRSVEIILTLLAFKCLYPHHMHLTRGNHEAKSMNTIYGAPLDRRLRSCRC